MSAPSMHDDASLSMSPGQYGGPPGGYGPPGGGGGFGPPPGGFGAPPGGYGGAPPPDGSGPPGFAPQGPPPPLGDGFVGHDRSYAEGKVKAPAITMMVLVGLGALLQVVSIVMNIIGTGMNASNASSDDRMAALTSGAAGIAIAALSIVSSAFSFYGLLKMMRLQSRGLVYAAVIASMVPCLGSCWCLNVFVGIWALVALGDEMVKRSFT